MVRRRVFLMEAIAASLAISADLRKSRDGWLLLADDCVNARGYRYSLESLRTMATSSKGMIVTLIPPCDLESGDIRAALGVVTESKLSCGAVWVRIRWFSGTSPCGFVAPWGVGSIEQHREPTVSDYRLERLVLSDYSSFSRATKVA